ncbi:hypothetical protein [Seonamhaeicola marinus]|uniref:T9SS type A sorting domain-containing protein n=1 Tax=Seonamhaeicola marinus TaxID=1912246 RepID=A0A5D0HSJ4_9FLAO|nr:hypothetical protein [Seonamhaeicola marinus]TYA73920.1 hypothetical protein FUA24_11255 [Seonamhaeicola marinus]
MKRIMYTIAIILTFKTGYGQTILTEGDIAITGVNLDDNDQFSFVLLKDITAGTEIHFADTGWNIFGEFEGYNAVTGEVSEGVITWSATTDLLCGAVVVIEKVGASNTLIVSSGTASVTDNGFGLSKVGDQVIAFQGSTDEPTFLYAVHLGNTTGWTDATNTNSSAVPAGLTEGVNAIYIGSLDNQVYNCAVSVGRTEILASVANTTNWSGSSSVRQSLGTCMYTCNTLGSCSETVTYNGTWSNGKGPDLTSEVIIAANYDTSGGNEFSACSLTVNEDVTLTIGENSYVEVENNVEVNGTLTVLSSGNFVQNSANGLFTLNGSASVVKHTPAKAKWYYYTYWSSPVVSETIEEAFPNTPESRRFYFDAAGYLDANNDGVEDNGTAWRIAAGTMTPGTGYIATESTFHLSGATGTANFEGQFNTGDITTNIVHNAANVGGSWNLIGNPYPSAIDFIAFQQANASVIDGVAYFWSQASPPEKTNPGTAVYNFNTNDYATFTVGSGGAAGTSGVTPTKYVPSAQSFFVVGLANDHATFTNAMRMADGISNSQFFKNSHTKRKVEKLDNKLWVNLTSDNGVFNQVLVAYVNGATNTDDGLYFDAPKLIVNEAAILYSKIENSNKSFMIQGRAANSLEEDNEAVKLGFKTNIEVATLYKLSLADIQGEFLTNSRIYLKDNLLHKIHDLSGSDYTFTSEVGEFNDRFEITYKNTLLSTPNNFESSKSLKIISLEDDSVQFSVSNNLEITSIEIYDVFGRSLCKFKGKRNVETFRLSNLRTSVFVAKVELSNGIVIHKKALK